MAKLVIGAGAHLDHGLTEDHIEVIRQSVAGDEARFILRHVVLPEGVAPLPSALYGPMAGDAPVAEDDVEYVVRGDRAAPSRCIRRPARTCGEMVFIVAACREEEDAVFLLTAYGGPGVAPREPGDAARVSPECLAESEAFWAVHALAI